MLGRKQSMKGDEVLADYGAGETLTQLGISGDVEWLWVRRLLRLFALLSLVSVSLNTTRTFERYEYLFYATFIVDTIVTILFTIEMIVKMYIRGFLMGAFSYLKDRWCQFDAAMVFFLWISVILQVFEMLQVVPKFSYLSILRAPRPLIMIRFIRVFLKFSMPKSRINQIFKRSSQQIYNVTLFFLFFMSLYGLLGVQFFGEMSNHCVVNGTDPKNVTLDDLAIPDTYCSNIPDAGYHCPDGMVCMELELPKSISGFNGFDDFAHSFFTVYQAASQEGWALLMYKAMDSLPAWRAICYFTTMIFFLAWLVKNVFIAVITETFNEIRVQFQQMWGERGTIQTQSTAQVLKGDDSGWKLITVDENKGRGKAPHCLQVFLQSAVFQVIVMMVNVANAIVGASIKYEHDGRPREEFFKHYYLAEVGFTIFFNLEVLFKIWCLGFHGYYRRSLHKFELLLAIGTTIHIIPDFYMREMSSFQVLRIVRLIKASPVLEDFVYKIFGPGKKLGSLIIFTMCLLVITSSISMQLFCSLGDFNKFEAFPEAFMSMFQILTQEGWGEVMNETMLRTSRTIGPLVAIYFILYHLFVTLIVLSLFVAVILDNLELDEDIKKVKQLKAREQSAGIKEGLPLRLLLFERFPDSPQMSRLNKVPSEFIVPKHNLSFKKLCGEAADFDSSSLKEWKDAVLQDILERYESANVFNVDECGLFYRILPDRTLCFKGEKCVGGKKSKERLTVLLAANMDGSEKIIPLVIGKFLKPRCMKNCKSLPLFYDANSKAWMTADIWEKTLRRWDLNFSKQKRKVALIADICTAHCTVDGLKSIELVFLPPNSTCVLQPLDQGIIQNFKATYKKLLLQDMISAIDRKEQLQVSVLNAIFYIDQSWNMVSQKTIANCFRHAGFHSSPECIIFKNTSVSSIKLYLQNIL
ncbi:Sodium leak channel non-selective protein [Araneus ventricosus]|uniref:Sodium leak channel non-selective protein n=1 Tax=Araneus ventricosus TaxID=182803 RepID=A0A4Y2QP11_ARAVE|nr:Sodium leak channel non-selective protein [Araneus ventricosus]